MTRVIYKIDGTIMAYSSSDHKAISGTYETELRGCIMAMLSPDIVSRIPVGLYGREMDNVAWFVFQEASPELLRFSAANHVQAFQFVKMPGPGLDSPARTNPQIW